MFRELIRLGLEIIARRPSCIAWVDCNARAGRSSRADASFHPIAAKHRLQGDDVDVLAPSGRGAYVCVLAVGASSIRHAQTFSQGCRIACPAQRSSRRITSRSGALRGNVAAMRRADAPAGGGARTDERRMVPRRAPRHSPPKETRRWRLPGVALEGRLRWPRRTPGILPMEPHDQQKARRTRASGACSPCSTTPSR